MNSNHKHQTLLVIVLGLLVLHFIFKSPWFLYSAAGIGIVSLIIPSLGDIIVKGWFELARILGWVNSRILLTIVFYVFLLPLALLSRLFTKDPLILKKGTKRDSIFETRNHKYTKEDLENLW